MGLSPRALSARDRRLALLIDGMKSVEELVFLSGLGEEATCRATLGLDLEADDTLGAALLLEHLFAHLEALPGVTLRARPETEPRADQAGPPVQRLTPPLHLR